MVQNWREQHLVVTDRKPAPAGYTHPSEVTLKNDVVKIFIGASEDMDEAALKVIKYSLLKNTQAKLDITVLRPSMFEGWNTDAWGTPFSCFRYAIPSMCEGKGRAIYMDVDMINLRDIHDLWTEHMYGKPFAMVWDAEQDNGEGNPKGWWCDSVWLIDCEKAIDWFDLNEIKNFPTEKGSYKWTFMEKLGSPTREESDKWVHELDCRWNSFDGANTSTTPHGEGYFGKYLLELDECWQIHLTALSYQPWHPRYLLAAKATHWRPEIAALWWELLEEVNQL